jgi:hypothetical protein
VSGRIDIVFSEIKNQKKASVERVYYIGLDIHKKTMFFCVKK